MLQNIFILKTDTYYCNVGIITLAFFFFFPSSGINKIGLKAECLSKAGALQALPPLILYIHQFIRALSSFHLHYHQDH